MKNTAWKMHGLSMENAWKGHGKRMEGHEKRMERAWEIERKMISRKGLRNPTGTACLAHSNGK